MRHHDHSGIHFSNHLLQRIGVSVGRVLRQLFILRVDDFAKIVSGDLTRQPGQVESSHHSRNALPQFGAKALGGSDGFNSCLANGAATMLGKNQNAVSH